MNRLALAAAILAAAGLAARAETPAPFESLLAKALQGPAAQEAKAQIDRSAADADAARGDLLPQVGAGVTGWSLGRDPGLVIPRGVIGNPIPLSLVAADRRDYAAAITAEQLVWDGGKASRALRAARLGLDAARLAADAVDEVVRCRTVVAVAEWDRAVALGAAAKATVADKQELVRQVEALVKQEQAPQADLLQAQAGLAMARLEEADRAADLGRTRAAVERLIGEPLPADAVPSWPADLPPLPEGTVDEVAARAAENRPAPRAYAKIAEAQRAAASAASAARLPEVKLKGMVQRLDDDYQLNKDNAELAVVAKVPIYTGGKLAAARAAREADARRGDAQAEQARREAREQVAAAWAEDAAAGTRLAAAQAADEAAREALRLAKLRYDNELITARDLLSAEDDAAHARQALAAARTGRRAARLAARIAAGERPLPPRS